jgi:hypothetical protein
LCHKGEAITEDFAVRQWLAMVDNFECLSSGQR